MTEMGQFVNAKLCAKVPIGQSNAPYYKSGALPLKLCRRKSFTEERCVLSWFELAQVGVSFATFLDMVLPNF
jgi:hypothetical protein